MFLSISFFLFLNNDNISSACIKWVEWWRALNQFVWAGNHQDFGSVYTQPLQGQEKLLSMEQSPKAAPSQLHVPSESKLIKHFSKICFENYQNGRKWSYEYNLLFKRVELSEHAERLIFEPKPIKFTLLLTSKLKQTQYNFPHFKMQVSVVSLIEKVIQQKQLQVTNHYQVLRLCDFHPQTTNLILWRNYFVFWARGVILAKFHCRVSTWYY